MIHLIKQMNQYANTTRKKEESDQNITSIESNEKPNNTENENNKDEVKE